LSLKQGNFPGSEGGCLVLVTPEWLSRWPNWKPRLEVWK